MDLKIKDVADLLSVSETTIRRWLTEQKIPAYRIHGQFRFSRSEIEDWVINQKIGRQSSKPHLTDAHEEDTTSDKASNNNSGGIKQFSLLRSIHKGGVYNNIPGHSKEEVIRNTMKVLAKDLGFDAEVLTELLLDRERLMPTSLNNGVSIPHARDFLLNTHHDVVAIVFPEHPLEYGSLNGKPVHTLFFLLASDDKRHLHLLAKIAHLTNVPETLDFLQTKPSKEQLLDYVKSWESSLSLR